LFQSVALAVLAVSAPAQSFDGGPGGPIFDD